MHYTLCTTRCFLNNRIGARRSSPPSPGWLAGWLATRTRFQHRTTATTAIVFIPSRNHSTRMGSSFLSLRLLQSRGRKNRGFVLGLLLRHAPIRTISSSVHATFVTRPAAKSVCIAGASIGGTRNSRRLLPHGGSTDTSERTGGNWRTLGGSIKRNPARVAELLARQPDVSRIILCTIHDHKERVSDRRLH